MDLEHGGKTTARYKGHPSPATHASTSTADPQVFLTLSRNDSHARLFDVRYPNPVISFKAQTHGGVGPIALAHPDGIPTIFTSGGSYQDFKVWDLRSRACVYKLGLIDECDMIMHSLAWDSGRNTLYSWKPVFKDGASDYSESGEELTAYNQIVRYAFKEKPRYSMLPPDNPKLNEVEYFEEEYNTDPPLDDSDEDYVN